MSCVAGCVSQGKDEKEALAHIRKAIPAWLWAEDQKAKVRGPTVDEFLELL
jgi:predicted RNase H-like HicB family nuclease